MAGSSVVKNWQSELVIRRWPRQGVTRLRFTIDVPVGNLVLARGVRWLGSIELRLVDNDITQLACQSWIGWPFFRDPNGIPYQTARFSIVCPGFWFGKNRIWLFANAPSTPPRPLSSIRFEKITSFLTNAQPLNRSTIAAKRSKHTAPKIARL